MQAASPPRNSTARSICGRREILGGERRHTEQIQGASATPNAARSNATTTKPIPSVATPKIQVKSQIERRTVRDCAVVFPHFLQNRSAFSV